MTNEYTIGIFQTQDEAQARRVLGHFSPTHQARFTYKEGWYEIWIPEQFREVASYLNEIAHSVAHTNLIALPLQTFQEAA